MDNQPARNSSFYGLLLLGLSACASTTAGAHPHDMSVSGHEEMASAEGTASEAHADAFDPNASKSTENCSFIPIGMRNDLVPTCWTSTKNPTEEHRRDADLHTKRAEEHRAAAQALRDAEAASCSGISAADRDMSPFHHREDIARVEIAPNGSGAQIVFRAVPGLSAELLQRMVDCHVARNASLGHTVPEMPYCPLVPNGVVGKVTQQGQELTVTVESADPKSAAEIVRRARELAIPTSG